VIRQITGHKDLTILQTYLQDDLDLTDIAVQRLAELDQGVRGEIREKASEAEVIPIRQKRRRGHRRGLQTGIGGCAGTQAGFT